jgi:hypothetical protein
VFIFPWLLLFLSELFILTVRLYMWVGVASVGMGGDRRVGGDRNSTLQAAPISLSRLEKPTLFKETITSCKSRSNRGNMNSLLIILEVVSSAKASAVNRQCEDASILHKQFF